MLRYDAVAHEQLANEIALLSGQGPTAETAANCPTYAALDAAGTGPDEQVLGDGCVYPARPQTLAGPAEAKHLTWRAYVRASMKPARSRAPCAHPALGAGRSYGRADRARARMRRFATRSCTSNRSGLARAVPADDVGLEALKADLAAPSDAELSYIVPDRCHDGNPTPCTAGAPAGLAPADTLLAAGRARDPRARRPTRKAACS